MKKFLTKSRDGQPKFAPSPQVYLYLSYPYLYSLPASASGNFPSRQTVLRHHVLIKADKERNCDKGMDGELEREEEGCARAEGIAREEGKVKCMTD